jgi:transketolase
VTLENPLAALTADQERRNAALLATSTTLGDHVRSEVLPFVVDPVRDAFSTDVDATLGALEKTAAAIAIKSLVSLSKVNDIDHLGGGLELIPSLLLTLATVDYETRHFTIEHGHTSIGYFSALAALGFLPETRVIDHFRRSLDIAGHVSWVPGGTQLSSGRLGVMMPVGTGLALGLKALKGSRAAVICHCGDAGWISGQALNGFIAASLHHAPIMFVMHRNGIQLSGTTDRVMNKDPRGPIASLGIEILEITSLHDRSALFGAYRHALTLASEGRPSMIYPTGWRSSPEAPVTVATFGEKYGIAEETSQFAQKHAVPLDTNIWIPGSLMSFRDSHAMLECLFYVNHLPGGEGHHDGGMKGRDGQAVLANPLLALDAAEAAALARLESTPPRIVVTSARPPKGTPNLVLPAEAIAGVKLPGPDKPVSARAGSEAAYAAVAAAHPNRCFFVSCDLNPSTKLGKAADLVPPTHRFEMSIQEQAAALMVDGLSFTGPDPQINVVATFSAFMEGIAREGFEMWRYQRNLGGANEGLNVIMHLAHVGANTGRDHFSGWSLDWVNLALGYLPFLRRFYAPADARAAFLAVKDAAAARGGHIVAVPRDSLPVLTKADGATPLWNAGDEWTPTTMLRENAGARSMILALGAPSYMAAAAADAAAASGTPVNACVINGLPLPGGYFASLVGRYDRVVTIEDGLIGTVDSGLRGFAGFVSSQLHASDIDLRHLGIADPAVAPSETFQLVWDHFGMTIEALTRAAAGPSSRG